MISFSVENWSDVKAEAAPMWPLHWEEVGQNKIKMQLDPDIAKLDRMNAAGMLHIVIARDKGRLVGYHASIIDTLVHYRTILAAKGDLHWLHPDYRKGMTGIKLLKEVERTLKARGVKVMYDFTKTYLNKGPVFEHLGYRHIENTFSKWIGD